MAYTQLYLAAPLALILPKPWESNIKSLAHNLFPTPSLVQRDFNRIISQIGSPASLPKLRGIPPGRPKGFTLEPRPFQKIVFKTKKKPVSNEIIV